MKHKLHFSILPATLVVVSVVILGFTPSSQAQSKITKGEVVDISTGFPGGNGVVEAIEGNVVRLKPDLRTTPSEWPYWYISVRANKPGTVTFETPETWNSRKNGAIGFQGAGISTDQGKTWEWMGPDSVQGNVFYYDFKKAGEEVRFSSSLPYVQSHFDVLLEENATNPHVTKGVLTKSTNGREVELLQIGKEGEGVEPVLVTGRQHANESVSTYVLDGFLRAAMSDTPEGIAFRKKYVIFAVPFVDKDGVEEGDQGKNRKPHDHNRDWSESPLYPETIALMELDKKKDFKLAIDFHNPTLLMDIHQTIYFGGLQSPPPRNLENLKEFGRLIKEGMPENGPGGPVMMAKGQPKKQEHKHSHYFGFKPGAVMVCTLEFPYAPKYGKYTPDMNPAALREYGRVILEAWTKMEFVK